MTFYIISGAVLTVCGMTAILRLQFYRKFQAEIRAIHQAVKNHRSTPINLRNYVNLPEPVLRYFHYTKINGRIPSSSIKLIHHGYFRTAQDAPWRKIRGTEHFILNKPYFIWNARIKMFPWVPVNARDKFDETGGNVLVKLFGAFTIGNDRGPEIDLSSFIRYYAEAPWFPSALLPGPNLTWKSVDDQKAMCKIRYKNLEADLIFSFDETGRLRRMETSDRFRGKIKEKWVINYFSYNEFNGINIPSKCEVMWIKGNIKYNYAKFIVTDIVRD